MATNWNLAQVLVGVLTILITNSLFRSSGWILVKIRRVLYPKQFTCERLEWSDIPEGLLHSCTLPKENCQHIVHVPEPKEEWEPMICTFFHWIKRGRVAPKPDGLDVGTRYVRTDQQVLKALIVLNWHKEPCLVFEDVGSITTAYFKPLNPTFGNWNQAARTEVKKWEVSRILDGYPPWYSEKLLLCNGDIIPHPIQDKDDIPRGGWIVALGCSTAAPTVRQFMTWRSKEEVDAHGLIRNSILVNRAFVRIIECLGHAAEAFPEEPAWAHAQTWVQKVINVSSMSGAWILYRDSPLSTLFKNDNGEIASRWIQDTKREYAAKLTTHQCLMAMQAFNHPGKLSAEEKESIRPVMLLVVRAVLVGTYQVLDYRERESDVGTQGMKRMWVELEEKYRPIYLREWKEGDLE